MKRQIKQLRNREGASMFWKPEWKTR